MKSRSSFLSLGLHPTLSALLGRMRISRPTHIQLAALPTLLSTDYHHFLAAQTGTGKTFAYLLPYLQRFVREKEGKPRGVVITANRELVAQLEFVLEPFRKGLGLTVSAAYDKQFVADAHIVCGTMDRVLGLEASGDLFLENAKELVIDECDTLIDSGKATHIEDVISKVTAKRNTRLILASATFPRSLEAILDSSFTTHPQTTTFHPFLKRVIEEKAHSNLEHLKHDFVLLGNEKKDSVFLRLLNDIRKEMNKKSCMVFCNSIESVQKTAEIIRKQKCSVAVIHSGSSSEERLGAYREFRQGEKQFLVCTDLCSRGLDFPNVSHVVQFDFPKTASDYLHRAGRTGRCFQSGTVVTLYQSANEKMVRVLQASFESQTPLKIPSSATS